MSSTLEDAENIVRQVQVKPVKPSQIPSRPASGLEIRRDRPHDFMISTAGSPQATAVPPATPTLMSPMAISKIPKAPQTPLNALFLNSLNSKSAAGHRSSLPVPRRGHEMLIPQSPPALVCALRRQQDLPINLCRNVKSPTVWPTVTSHCQVLPSRVSSTQTAPPRPSALLSMQKLAVRPWQRGPSCALRASPHRRPN